MTRPNVLFIMADQYRHDYMGCAGATFVQTTRDNEWVWFGHGYSWWEWATGNE